jgi:Flp pilus assembly protein TadB
VSFGRKIMMRNRLKVAKRRYRDEKAVSKHLNKVLQATSSKSVKSSHFLWFCGLLFVGVSAVGLRSMSIFVAVATGLVTAMLPYLILRMKLEIMRKKSSFEGEIFVGNFLSAYKMSNCNIFEAMEKTGREKQKTKNCSELMVKILLEVRNTANHTEIDKATDKFAYIINTNWSKMFAYNINLAITHGTNISLALEDVLIQLREAKVASEARKRINAEAARMVKFFIPALYFLSVFMAIRYVEIPFGRFVYNQVFTSQGFTLLAASVFLFVMNLALVEIVNNQQFDY